MPPPSTASPFAVSDEETFVFTLCRAYDYSSDAKYVQGLRKSFASGTVATDPCTCVCGELRLSREKRGWGISRDCLRLVGKLDNLSAEELSAALSKLQARFFSRYQMPLDVDRFAQWAEVRTTATRGLAFPCVCLGLTGWRGMDPQSQANQAQLADMPLFVPSEYASRLRTTPAAPTAGYAPADELRRAVLKQAASRVQIEEVPEPAAAAVSGPGGLAPVTEEVSVFGTPATSRTAVRTRQLSIPLAIAPF